MKSLKFLILALLFITSCSTEPIPTTEPTATDVPIITPSETIAPTEADPEADVPDDDGEDR